MSIKEENKRLSQKEFTMMEAKLINIKASQFF